MLGTAEMPGAVTVARSSTTAMAFRTGVPDDGADAHAMAERGEIGHATRSAVRTFLLAYGGARPTGRPSGIERVNQ